MEKEKLLEKELDVVAEIGFKDKEEFIEEAVKTYLAARKDVRIDLAAALYKEERVSFGKALEISGLNIEEFKKELNKRRIERRSGDSNKSKLNVLKYSGKL